MPAVECLAASFGRRSTTPLGFPAPVACGAAHRGGDAAAHPMLHPAPRFLFFRQHDHVQQIPAMLLTVTTVLPIPVSFLGVSLRDRAAPAEPVARSRPFGRASLTPPSASRTARPLPGGSLARRAPPAQSPPRLPSGSVPGTVLPDVRYPGSGLLYALRRLGSHTRRSGLHQPTPPAFHYARDASEPPSNTPEHDKIAPGGCREQCVAFCVASRLRSTYTINSMTCASHIGLTRGSGCRWKQAVSSAASQIASPTNPLTAAHGGIESGEAIVAGVGVHREDAFEPVHSRQPLVLKSTGCVATAIRKPQPKKHCGSTPGLSGVPGAGPRSRAVPDRPGLFR